MSTIKLLLVSVGYDPAQEVDLNDISRAQRSADNPGQAATLWQVFRQVIVLSPHLRQPLKCPVIRTLQVMAFFHADWYQASWVSFSSDRCYPNFFSVLHRSSLTTFPPTSKYTSRAQAGNSLISSIRFFILSSVSDSRMKSSANALFDVGSELKDGVHPAQRTVNLK